MAEKIRIMLDVFTDEGKRIYYAYEVYVNSQLVQADIKFVSGDKVTLEELLRGYKWAMRAVVKGIEQINRKYPDVTFEVLILSPSVVFNGWVTNKVSEKYRLKLEQFNEIVDEIPYRVSYNLMLDKKLFRQRVVCYEGKGEQEKYCKVSDFFAEMMAKETEG